MSDDDNERRPLPPPLPLSPFVVKSKDDTTAPGIGVPPELVASRRESQRLRRERDEALAELDAALAESDAAKPTRRQRVVGTSLRVGKWGALVTLLPALGVALAQLWPQYADVIQGAIDVVRSLGH